MRPSSRVSHSERFRKVSTRYPRRVVEAYGGDLSRAAADSDIMSMTDLLGLTPLPVVCGPALERDTSYGQRLLCPVCGHTYTHAAGPVEVPSHDEYGAAWDGRGDAIAIPISGECGHNWALVLGQHKGETYLFTSRAIPGQGWAITNI